MSDSIEIIARKNGSLVISSSAVVTDAQGNSQTIENKFALCRCGQSANKPFCDGTHKKIGFEAEESSIVLKVLP